MLLHIIEDDVALLKGRAGRRLALSTTDKISLVSIFVILGAWEFSRRGIELWLYYSSGADPTFVRGNAPP